MNVELRNPLQILCMAGGNPASELLEGFTDDVAAGIEPSRRVDDVADVEVDTESGPSDRPNQLQVCVRPIRQIPGHHLDGEPRPFRLHRVYDMAAVLNRRLLEFFRQVLRVHAIPD